MDSINAMTVLSESKSAWLIHPHPKSLIIPSLDAFLYTSGIAGKEQSVAVQTLEILKPEHNPNGVLVLATNMAKRVQEMLEVDPMEVQPEIAFATYGENKPKMNPDMKLYIVQGVRLATVKVSRSSYDEMLESAQNAA